MKLFDAVLAATKQQMSVSELVKLLTKYRDAYYNTGKNLVPDAKYDMLEDELRRRAPNNPFFKKVGARTTSRTKTKLPFPMGSLSKQKTSTVEAWLGSHEGPWVVSNKMDGVSVAQVGGAVNKAYTRGDGSYGQDISHLLPIIGAPKLPKGIAVRGELIMPTASFTRFAKEFENPRNMVSGLTNRSDIHAGTRAIHFIAYELLSPRMPPSKAFVKLKQLGYRVAPYKIYRTLTAKILTDRYQEQKQKGGYDVDGLVIAQDKVTKQAGGIPTHTIAFKLEAVEEAQKATVEGIEWNVSKHGLWKPVALIKPIRLSGVTVKRATAFNFGYVKENRLGPGAVINLARSGAVIPHIVSVLKPATNGKPQLPPNGSYKLTKSGVDAVVLDLDSNENVLIKRTTHFFRTIGVEYFSGGLVERFAEHGLDTVGKIIKAKVADFLKIPGIKNTMATKIYEGIHDALDGVDTAVLMYASNAFDRGLGSKRFAIILKKYPNIQALAQLKPHVLATKIAELPGFSLTMSNLFVEGLPKYLKFLQATGLKPTVAKPKVVKQVSKKLAGQVVTMTGFRDAELAEKIAQNGGTYDDFSKKTTILLTKAGGKESSKADKARAFGATVMDVEAFKRKYKL